MRMIENIENKLAKSQANQNKPVHTNSVCCYEVEKKSVWAKIQ